MVGPQSRSKPSEVPESLRCVPDPTSQYKLHPALPHPGHALCAHVRPPLGAPEQRQRPGPDQRRPVCKSRPPPRLGNQSQAIADTCFTSELLLAKCYVVLLELFGDVLILAAFVAFHKYTQSIIEYILRSLWHNTTSVQVCLTPVFSLIWV